MKHQNSSFILSLLHGTAQIEPNLHLLIVNIIKVLLSSFIMELEIINQNNCESFEKHKKEFGFCGFGITSL